MQVPMLLRGPFSMFGQCSHFGPPGQSDAAPVLHACLKKAGITGMPALMQWAASMRLMRACICMPVHR